MAYRRILSRLDQLTFRRYGASGHYGLSELNDAQHRRQGLLGMCEYHSRRTAKNPCGWTPIVSSGGAQDFEVDSNGQGLLCVMRSSRLRRTAKNLVDGRRSCHRAALFKALSITHSYRVNSYIYSCVIGK